MHRQTDTHLFPEEEVLGKVLVTKVILNLSPNVVRQRRLKEHGPRSMGAGVGGSKRRKEHACVVVHRCVIHWGKRETASQVVVSWG